MIDVAFWQAVKLTATNAQTPAEVYLLIVGKETTIQSAHAPIVFGTNHQRSTCCPENLRCIVILPVVILHRVEDTTATEWIAITIQIPPTCPSIFEGILIIYREQLRLTRSHLRMNIHKLYHGR